MQTSPKPTDAANDLRRAILTAIRRRDLTTADDLCAKLEQLLPEEPDAFGFRARISQQRADYIASANWANKALGFAPHRQDLQLVSAEAKIFIGDIAGTIADLEAIQQSTPKNPEITRQLSTLFSQLQRHDAAYDCAKATLSLAPDSVPSLYLMASASIAVGKLDEAEKLINQIIRKVPEESDIFYNLSTLRKQAKDRNHVEQLTRILSSIPQDDPRVTSIAYALGKEYEDLGQHSEAFDHYDLGAKARHRRLNYDVKGDEAVADRIIQTFSKDWWQEHPAGDSQHAPIFVLGLPRSGTTLIDRILSAHSKVASLGEVNDVAYAVTRAGFPANDKLDLISHSATSDMSQLGNEIGIAFSGYGENVPHLLDKTPGNYLYLGLIAKSLPQAKLVHVHRHPMASGFAVYKALFRMGYPFSYNLTSLARYYAAYHRMMAHWRTLFPDRILDVRYEDLVDDQEKLSRLIISHIGLNWEEACLDFHKNKAPTATASAAQVRQPLYSTSRDLWRVHEERLAPFRSTLKELNVPCPE